MSEASAGKRRTRDTKPSRFMGRVLLVCAFAAAGIAGAVALAFAAPAQTGGSAQVVAAPQEMSYACARKSGGVLRYATSSGACSAKEVSITLSDDEPLFACASESGKTVRRVSRLGKCSSSETRLTLPGENETRFCAARKDGRLRYPSGSAGCGRKETAVFVPPANRAPVADDDSYTVDEDGTLDILAPGVLDGDADADSDPLTAVLVAGPANDESFTLNPDGSFAYEPDADFNGTDTFTYKANDGKRGGNTATVTITVDPANDAPTGIQLSNASVDENQPSGTDVGTLSTTDKDAGDTFTYTLVSGEGDDDNAKFAVTGSSLKTNDAFDFESKDTYTIRVRSTDGANESTEKQFTITITNANDGPTDIALSNDDVDENEAVGTDVGDLSTTDPDAGDTHTYSLVAGSGDADNSSFRLDGSTLETAGPLDFEDGSTLSVRVRTDDGKGGRFEESFTITVSDANDAPTDISLSDNTVDENQTPGTEIGTFSADDEDGDTPTYAFASGTGDEDNGSFTITGNTLKTSGSFDFEGKDSYTIRVQADDGNGGTSEKQFTISVSDINDAPTDIALSNASVAENQPSGTDVGDFSTTDQDAGDTHAYSLVAGSGDADNASFRVSGGKLQTNGTFDLETKSSYTVRVRSTDGANESTEKQFTITVTNANDGPTDIALSNSKVVEHQPNGTPVGDFSTTDQDTADSHAYALVAGAGDADNGLFRISGSELQTNADLETGTYSVRVQTNDGNGDTFEESFTITVMPPNANPTDIALSNDDVDENEAVGTDVGDLSTTDPDAGDTHTYSLVAGSGDADNSSFRLDGSTLETAGPLDFEDGSTLSVRVRTDDGKGGRFEESFTITVNDVNDAPTDISLSPSSVAENQPSGTEVGPLSTTDQDAGDTHTYSLVSGDGAADNASFTTSGDKLQTAASFDFENKSSYSVRVQTDDGDGGTFQKALTVTVTDANDAPTDIALSNASVDENEPSGTEVGTFSSTDQDAGDTQHTYALVAGTGDADNGSFRITGNTLETDEQFNREAKSIYSVRVQTNDGNGGTFEKQFTITINNVNEAPTDVSLSNATVAENRSSGATVGTLSTTDQDAGDAFIYELVPGTGDTDNSSFQIDGSTLETAATFDFETKSSYTVRVRSTDSGNLSTEKQLTITIANANDAPTNISLSRSDIDENKSAGSDVGTLSTTDQDAVDSHAYSLVAGTGDTNNGAFTISGGTLKTAASFNFENKSSYTIRVRTTDSGNANFEKQFTVTVNDVNDAPVADDESFSGASRAVGNTSFVVNDDSDGAPDPGGPEKTIIGDILAGDTDEDGSGSLAVVAESNKATNDGGTVAIEADGDFTFHPKAGTSCTDTSDFFDYTLTDQNATKPPGSAATDTGRVTITIADCVWYLDGSAATNGDGRSHSPFNTLNVSGGSGLNGAGGTGDSDAANHRIFVYDGTYSGGLPLENGQLLFSQRHGLVVPDGGSGNVTLEPAVPAGPNTTIANATGNALTLASNNTIQGIDLGSTNAASASLAGSSVGSATMNTSTSGSINNASGGAVDISGGTLNMTFAGVSSSGATNDGIRLDNTQGTFTGSGGSIQNAGGQDVDVSGNNASDDVAFTYGGTITDDTGTLVSVANQSGGTKDFNGAITDGNDGDGSGISLSNNSGATVRFDGGLTLSTGTANAFSATGGGTVAVTGANNTIATTTGIALNVANTTIGSDKLTFKSISAGTAASGPTNGIVLNNTGNTAGLTVSGNGGTCDSRSATCTGGTIQKTGGDGISLTNTMSPSFAQMKILDTGGSGVEGTEVTNFGYTDGTIDNSGTASGVDDSNIAFNRGASPFTQNNVDGNVTITGNKLSNPHYHGVDIFNWAGVLDSANVSGNTITAKSGGPHSLGSAIRLIARGENVTSASVTRANLDNNTVQNGWQGGGIQAQGGHVGSAPAVTFGTPGSATNVISISGNTLNATAADPFNAEGIIALHNHAGQANFRINNNGTVAIPIGKMKGTAISNSAFGDVTVTSEVKGNHIAPNNIFASQGIGVGTSSSVPPPTSQTTDFTVAVEDNVISQTDGAGILAVTGDAQGLMKIAIKGNDVAGPLSSGRQGIVVRAGNSNGDNDVCLDIAGNKSAAPPSAPQFLGIGLRKQGTSSTVNAFGIEGMTATSSPGVESYVDGLNPNGNGTLLISATSGFTSCSSAP